MPVRIRPATASDLESVAQLAAALWPEERPSDHAAHAASILSGKQDGGMPLVLFVAEVALSHVTTPPSADVPSRLTTPPSADVPSRLTTPPSADVPSGARSRRGSVIGFIEVGLRSHADGCDTSRPVGFVEGWYVRPPYQRSGVGRALMTGAEEWARQQGAREIASDTWIDNEPSQKAHEALGFEVVDRCVNYRKAL